MEIEEIIKRQDINALKEVIENGVDVSNVKFIDFIFEVEEIDFVFLRILIDNGVNINEKDDDGYILLESILEENNEGKILIKDRTFLKYLIDYIAQNNFYEQNFLEELIITLIIFDEIELIELMVSYSININIETNEDIPLIFLSLLYGSKKNKKKLIQLLIDNGADVNTMHEKMSILAMASLFGEVEIVELLLKNGANFNTKGKEIDLLVLILFPTYSRTKLFEFELKKIDLTILKKVDIANPFLNIGKNQKEIVQLFIDNGLNVNVLIKGMPILFMASLFAEVEIVELLLKNGANPHVKLKGESLFGMLLMITKKMLKLFNSSIIDEYSLEQFSNFEKNKYDIAKLFIKYGVNINEVKFQNMPLLTLCILNQDIFNQKIGDLTELSIEEKEKSLTFMNSMNFGNIEVAKFLIDNGADVNIKYDGDTLLFHACRLNNIPMVKLLCENGANINEVNESGETILFQACRKNKVTLVQTLLELGADVNIKSSSGFKTTALVMACKNENSGIVKLLVDAGANINVNMFDDNYVNAYSYGQKNKEIKKILLKCGINTNVIDLSTNEREETEDTEEIKKLNKKLKENKLKLKELKLKEKEKNILFFKSMQKTPITEILKSKDTEALKRLLNKGYDVQYVDIISLVKEDYPLEFIELIVAENRQDINIQDNEGNTALMVASKMNNLDMVNMLLKYYPDVNIKNKNDEEAWELTDNDDIMKRLVNFEDEIVSNHQPKELVKLLRKFSNSDELRFTNHPWSINLDYEKFMGNLKSAWQQERNNLKRIAPKLYEEIDKLLFSKDETLSWSSSIIKRDIEEKNFNSENIKKLQEQIKSLIVIKQNDKKLKLLKKFTKIKKELKQEGKLEIKLDLDDLKEDKIDKIFTDVQRLEQALKLILLDINENAKEDTQDVVIEANIVDKETMVELKIIHIDSTSPKTADGLKETINKNGGNFKSIYTHLFSVCDWSIDTICSDGNRYKIDYLYPQIDNSEPHCTKIDKTPRGFTHILRFYI